MLNIIKFSSIFFFILFCSHLYAAKASVLYANKITIVFDEPLRAAAGQVANIYPTIKRDLEKIFHWSVDFQPTVVLIQERQHFQRMAGTDVIVAFAVPQKNAMVIDYSKMHSTPFTLETTLKHELCHLLLHHHINKVKLPKWLDEGVSQWASDGIAEVIMDYNRSILPQAILSGRYYRMRTLDDSFPREKRSLQLAYAQSKSFVDYMGREFGKDIILNLLNSLRHGLTLDTAIEENFSISFADLEKRWLSHMRKKTTWFTYFTIHVYEILFFLGAVVVIVGFVRLLIKKRTYKDFDEEEEV